MRNLEFAEKAIPGLMKLLNDRSSYVQYIAIEALKKIADKKLGAAYYLYRYLPLFPRPSIIVKVLLRVLSNQIIFLAQYGKLK